ncbi:MAG: FAD-binding oxidoreductase [Betaproteobacteria bacterium]|nr:FAD-binding oxidoreductase [Betaproteobacteria bacterium]
MLANVVGREGIFTDPADMAPHQRDWRGRYVGRARCVVRPASTAEVAAVVACCSQAGVGMVPQGGNTGLCGGATPDASGREVVVSLSRLNRIRDVDTAGNTLTAEAGCTLHAVQAAAEAAGRLFPLSVASEGSCEIGGNLSTNAGGVHVLRYGNMRNLTLGLEVVLPDGQIWNGLRRLRKDNSGYDLKQLFIGAEGTLGIITSAVLALHPRPRSTALAWIALDDPSAAVRLFALLQDGFGERLNAFELVGRAALELVLQHVPGSRNPFKAAHPWHVLVELCDTLLDSPLESMLADALAAELGAGHLRDVLLAQNLGQSRELWRLRENISEAQRIEGFSIKHDISLPVARVPEFLDAAARALIREFGNVRVVVFGHLGDGNLHYNLSRPVSEDNAVLIEQSQAVNRIVYDLASNLGGSISAEHGLGQLKRVEILRHKSPLEMNLMRRIKTALDPRGLMNPGKVL